MTQHQDVARLNGATGRRPVFLRKLIFALSIAYVLFLIAATGALRLIGENWWVTTFALYIPRIVFALPLFPVLALAAFVHERRLTVCVVLAGLLVVFPLGGLQMSRQRSAAESSFALRIASCNVATGILGAEKIVEAFKSSRVDIMILQESTPDLNLRLAAVSAGFAVNGTEQFWIASRFPIEEVHQPPKLQFEGRERSPRFIRYRISTPRGPLVLYNVHFISPRDGLDELRGQGFRYELLRGRLFSAAGRATLDANTKLRLAQMDAVRADAAGSAEPTIIAGDTNLPQLSWALADRFGAYTDGFTAVGRGFGYTFPAPKHPWMRIDRVLADRNFRFLNFKRIAVPLSDHYPVVADLEWRP